MELTSSKRKNALQPIIEEHFEPLLSEAGFVSYKNEGFHWYKVQNCLLYKVHLPLTFVGSPAQFDIGYGVVPLFSKEIIPPGDTRSSWYSLGGMFGANAGHYCPLYSYDEELYCQLIGEVFPKEKYTRPIIHYHTNDGILIGHLKSKECGAEALREIIFPVMNRLETVEQVYDWNKKLHLFMVNRQDDHSLKKEHHSIPYAGIKEYLKALAEKSKMERIYPPFSSTLADQCLYCHDEELFPVLHELLLYFVKDTEERFLLPSHTKREKPIKKILLEANQHLRILLSVLETGDKEQLKLEFDRVKANMLKTIQKKLPELTNKVDDVFP